MNVHRCGPSGCSFSPDLVASCQALGLDPHDVAPDNKPFQVIISAPDRASASRAEKECQDRLVLEISDRLDIVNGFITEVDAEDLSELRRILPRGSVVNADAPMGFQPLIDDPGPIQPPVEDPARVFQPALPGLAAVHQAGFTGRGVTVAVIDSGMFPHPDFKDRIKGWADFSTTRTEQPSDPKWGHGTLVTGVLAGDGARSNGLLKGVAPECSLVGVRIDPIPSQAIKALQWVIENRERLGIQVVNLSLGDAARSPHAQDLWAQVTQQAIDAGLVVVVAAGNEGPSAGTISTPGVLPDAITVGAYDHRGTPRMEDDQIWRFSSRGPTAHDGVSKPDVVAPGGRIFGALSPGSGKDSGELTRVGRDYVADSGTSFATPMVAGLAAVLLQANPALKQADLKRILRESARPLVPGDANVQGAGLVHADRALELARAPRA